MAGEPRGVVVGATAARGVLVALLSISLVGCMGRPMREFQIAATVERPLTVQVIGFNSSGEERVLEEVELQGVTTIDSRIFGDCSGDDETDPHILRLLDRRTGEVVAERDLTARPICNKDQLVTDGHDIQTTIRGHTR